MAHYQDTMQTQMTSQNTMQRPTPPCKDKTKTCKLKNGQDIDRQRKRLKPSEDPTRKLPHANTNFTKANPMQTYIKGKVKAK